jgi:putative hydrolase of the HAD superfamily
MRFYRPLGQISALTFDLDDTLYDNREVILRTEQESLAFVQNYHPALKAMQNKDFRSCVSPCGRPSRTFTTT